MDGEFNLTDGEMNYTVTIKDREVVQCFENDPFSDHWSIVAFVRLPIKIQLEVERLLLR